MGSSGKAATPAIEFIGVDKRFPARGFNKRCVRGIKIFKIPAGLLGAINFAKTPLL